MRMTELREIPQFAGGYNARAMPCSGLSQEFHQFQLEERLLTF